MVVERGYAAVTVSLPHHVQLPLWLWPRHRATERARIHSSNSMEDLHRQALEILLGAVTGLDNRCASIVAAHNQNDTSLSPRQRAKVLQAVRAFQLSYLAYDSDDDEDQGDDDEGDGDEDGVLIFCILFPNSP